MPPVTAPAVRRPSLSAQEAGSAEAATALGPAMFWTVKALAIVQPVASFTVRV